MIDDLIQGENLETHDDDLIRFEAEGAAPLPRQMNKVTSNTTTPGSGTQPTAPVDP